MLFGPLPDRTSEDTPHLQMNAAQFEIYQHQLSLHQHAHPPDSDYPPDDHHADEQPAAGEEGGDGQHEQETYYEPAAAAATPRRRIKRGLLSEEMIVDEEGEGEGGGKREAEGERERVMVEGEEEERAYQMGQRELGVLDRTSHSPLFFFAR